MSTLRQSLTGIAIAMMLSASPLFAQLSFHQDDPNTLRVHRDYKQVYDRLYLWYQEGNQSRDAVYPGLSYFSQGGALYSMNFTPTTSCIHGSLSAQIQVQLIADSTSSTLVKVKWPERDTSFQSNDMQMIINDLQRWLMTD